MLTGREDIIRAITKALAHEKGTKEFYSYAASKAKEAQVKDTFIALCDMEMRHMQYFDFLYLAVTEERDLLGYKEFSRNITSTHIESGTPLAKAEKLFDEKEVKTSRDALRLALSIEGRAHALYKSLAETAEDQEVKVIFEEMMAQELKHIEYLKDLEKLV